MVVQVECEWIHILTHIVDYIVCSPGRSKKIQASMHKASTTKLLNHVDSLSASTDPR